jgi:hypothetical protein
VALRIQCVKYVFALTLTLEASAILKKLADRIPPRRVKAGHALADCTSFESQAKYQRKRRGMSSGSTDSCASAKLELPRFIRA